MIRLLIVDDEPYTVDGMFEMLSELEDLELDLYTAYSSEDAIQRMARTKMDIVLSDIRMPVMDGLELQQWIQERWPRCKVIFLTGMGDIQYIQQAIRHGGLDYILKTEGDEAIEQAIRHAIKQIKDEAINENFMRRAKDQLWQALPLLRQDWFNGLLDSRSTGSNLRSVRMHELNITLKADQPFLLVAGRVDCWSKDEMISSQTLLLYAIQNIAEEYLARVAFLPIILEATHFVWMIQPHYRETGFGDLWQEEDWNDVINFVVGTMESIQSTCKDLLQLPISFVTNSKTTQWDSLSITYRQLKQAMVLGLGNGQEMLITYCDTESQDSGKEISERMISELEQALESGRIAEWRSLVDDLFALSSKNYAIYSQKYYSIAVLLLKQINSSMDDGLDDGESIKRLLDLEGHSTKESAVHYLNGIAATLIERKQRAVDERTHRIIQKLNHHIRNHLESDLSLDALSSIVFLNPSYLSSLYKQCTGMNISEYIADLRIDKSKELLSNSPIKIHEIAVRIGFGTAGYFTRFFKKHTGITPQEYRASHED